MFSYVRLWCSDNTALVVCFVFYRGKPKHQSSKDMPLNPQTQSNQTTGHNNAVDGNIQSSLPLSVKHSTPADSPGAEGDRDSSAHRKPREVNPSANGAGDMSINVNLIPASPTVDMDLKMESARKAWAIMETSEEKAAGEKQRPYI